MVSMLAKAFITFFISFTALCSALAVHQERKIWAPSNMPSISLFGLVKVFVFNVVWILLCAVGSFLICCKYILTGGKSDIQKEAHLVVEKTAAMICVSLFFGTVKVVGKENLPADENKIPAPVYIANHASQVDLGVVYYIERRFKWIAKKSVVCFGDFALTFNHDIRVQLNLRCILRLALGVSAWSRSDNVTGRPRTY